MSKKVLATVGGITAMLIGFVFLGVSQYAETPADITFWFISAFIGIIGGFVITSWYGLTDEDWATSFDRFAGWLERPRKYPPLPWRHTIAKLCLTPPLTLWAINWHGKPAIITGCIAAMVYLWALVPFAKALWHRAELMDKEECRKNYPDLPWP